MNKKSNKALAVLIGTLLLMAAPTCYFIAEQNNANDPKNLNEYMGLPVADTGQTECYDDDGVISCFFYHPLAPKYPRQDAHFNDKPNARNFAGPTQHLAYANDYTTKDNVTGLVWKSCPEGFEGSNCEVDNIDPNLYKWDDAINACDALNSINGGAGYAGINAWRLPTIVELGTLPNYGVVDPAVDEAYFPNSGTGLYWTITINVVDPVYKRWVIKFADGSNGTSNLDFGYGVRCVAGRRQ